MKNKKGKKLVVLGAMAALLTLIGVSGSQTYAKYVESKTLNSTQATVARWGFVLTANPDNLFASDHEAGDFATSTKADAPGEIIVNGEGNALVVAPGTAGYVDFEVSGTAEVKSALSFELLDGYTQISLTDDSMAKPYLPLHWTLSVSDNGGAFDEKFSSYNLDDIKNQMNLFNVTASPLTEYKKVFRISYKWAFFDSELYDVYDTVLAKKAEGVALTGDYAEYADATIETNVSFAVKMTLTQVQ